jgi:hypothetical protein
MDTQILLNSNSAAAEGAPANRRYALEFVSHWFYSIIGSGGRALSAPVAELGRWAASIERHPPPHCLVRREEETTP